jgi:hypothetical protein
MGVQVSVKSGSDLRSGAGGPDGYLWRFFARIWTGVLTGETGEMEVEESGVH